MATAKLVELEVALAHVNAAPSPQEGSMIDELMSGVYVHLAFCEVRVHSVLVLFVRRLAF